MKKEKLIKLGNYLLEQHGLTSKGWVFEAGNFSSFWGDCSEINKCIRVSSIIAETELDATIKDTILHEIAHAIVGCHNGHNAVWKRKAREIGCKPNSSANFSVATQKAQLKLVKWVMVYNSKIVKTYKRKPNKSTFASIKDYMVRGDNSSLGKLSLEQYNPTKHKEFV